MARGSAATGGGTSRALRIRSTSDTVGRVLPVSTRLILAWLKAHRAASLSPESPAARRNSRRVSARFFRLALCRPGSILTKWHGLLQRGIPPTTVLTHIIRLDQLAVAEGPVAVVVQQDDLGLIEY